MKKTINLFFIFLLLLSCAEDENMNTASFTFTFDQGMEGFSAGFADYPIAREGDIESEFALTDLPAPINQSGNQALKISGRNLSDDLFMFIKNKISGLQPSTTYQLVFNLRLASQYPENSVGIGGSPGGSVFLKAGATLYEPEVVPGYLGYDAYVMNLNKGNQGNEGTDMILLGTIGKPGDEFEYTLINRDNQGQPFTVQTNINGELWIIVGTDSGFEGVTTIYYDRIEITATEANSL
ncbi:MAG: hypothetical protein ACNS62_12690 [Candidatus Cyclobacteriaceae bacterium M3_2C_046]